MSIGKFFPIIAGVALAFVMQSATFAAETEIQSTLINTGDPNSVLPARQLTTIDTETVKCKGASQCILVMNVVDQILGGGAGGKWAILVSVDGTYVGGHGRSSQGYEPNGGISGVGSWQNFYKVSPGSHTVAVQVYVGTMAYQRRWSLSIGIGI